MPPVVFVGSEDQMHSSSSDMIMSAKRGCAIAGICVWYVVPVSSFFFCVAVL